MSVTQRISAMEKGQCPTVANWESGGNVTIRPRKPTPTTAAQGQVVSSILFLNLMIDQLLLKLIFNSAIELFA